MGRSSGHQSPAQRPDAEQWQKGQHQEDETHVGKKFLLLSWLASWGQAPSLAESRLHDYLSSERLNTGAIEMSANLIGCGERRIIQR